MGNRTNIGETKFERNRSAEVREKDKYETIGNTSEKNGQFSERYTSEVAIL